jgi:hypothetical protein
VPTIFPFTPSQSSPFQFQPTLDGTVYTVIVTWNLFGRRYYVNIYDLSGVLILCTAMVGSPQGYDVNLVGGYFTSSKMVFRQSSQQFEVSP